MNKADMLWVEKYRPQTIDECILSEDLSQTFSEIAKSGNVPNMLLSGTAGVGKTTIARAICHSLDLDYIIINASESGNIDTLRTTIKQFASTVSLQGGLKVVILDEADYLNAQSTQPALRGFMEEFSSNCRFILTCNFKNRIITPLHSRCSIYEFNTSKKALAYLSAAFMKRLERILTEEGVTYDKKVIANLIMTHAPDWRRVINECQRYSTSGTIDAGILSNMSDDSFTELVKHLKDKDFNKMRKWVGENSDTEPHVLFRKIYDTMTSKLTSNSVPQIILILADYQYKNAFVADHELNTAACLTEIMANSEWK
jgi:DNA polymerase III delta prime subunit|tara:strand:+ start:1625 stop:2566 length:942 start_codon:yes stop_codon:yes gene_type:complete